MKKPPNRPDVPGRRDHPEYRGDLTDPSVPPNQPDVAGRPDRPEYRGDTKDVVTSSPVGGGAKMPDLSGPLHAHLGPSRSPGAIKDGHHSLGRQPYPGPAGPPPLPVGRKKK